MPFQKGKSGNPNTQFKPGQSGNPNGVPKGTKHLSTWIQELLHDENFEVPTANGGNYKGAPIKAIITVAMVQALAGDKQWGDWLAKYGYGTKLDITTQGESINEKPDTKLAAEFAEFMKAKQ